MLPSSKRRRLSRRIIFCSIQWIALGMCVWSTNLIFIIGSCHAFSFSEKVLVGGSISHSSLHGKLSKFDKGVTTMLWQTDKSEDENDDETTSTSDVRIGLPALGPAGFCSNNENGTSVDKADTPADATATMNDQKCQHTNKVPTFVNPKFALQYTCNICETKNRVIVSRQAYREGLVIAVCKGCNNKHWIADNLDPTLSHSNIEEYFESRGEADTVNRVTEEVYEIERVWGLKEGQITDESGDTVLE